MIVQIDTFVVVISNSDDNTLKKAKQKCYGETKLVRK